MAVNSTETYKKSGDVFIKTLGIITATGVKIDLLPNSKGKGGVWGALNIFENIESPYVSGSVLVHEGQNLLQHLPIIGLETLIIEYKTPGVQEKYTKLECSVYKVGDRTFTGENQRFQMYKLHFVSKEYMQNIQKKVHKSYNGTVAENVYNIWKEHFSNSPNKNIDIEPTIGKYRFIIPYWTPFQTIDWLAERAVPWVQSDNTNYIFYANSDGYHFHPLSELINRNIQAEYTNRPSGNRKETGGIRDFHAELYNIIAGPELHRTADKIDEIQNGLYCSSLYVHDIHDKTFIEKNIYSYQQDFEKETHIETYPLISPSDISGISFLPETNRIYYPTHKNMHNLIEDNSMSETWLLQRRSLMEQRNANSIKISVWGDSGRRVGELVDFKLPSIEPLRSPEEWWDKQISSTYMITEISHTISKNEHKMWLTLSRDSLPTGIPDKSSYKDSRENKKENIQAFN
jgi:hypothetical protein